MSVSGTELPTIKKKKKNNDLEVDPVICWSVVQPLSQAVKDIPWFSGRRKCIIARKKLTDTGSLLALTEEKELSTLTD